MRLTKILAGLLLVLLSTFGAHAGLGTGVDLNEIGAFLVYPAVVALEGANTDWETFIAVTNSSNTPFRLHAAYINGDSASTEYCYECNFPIDMTPNDTEMLVVTFDQFGIQIEAEDGTVAQTCPHPFGFLTINVESTTLPGVTLSNNVLQGSEVVVNYTQGYAYSVPAIPFQGGVNDGTRSYGFDGTEYPRFPSVIAADFIAPDIATGQTPYIFADLALFTLGFDRQHAPRVDCSVTGYDAAEVPFSRSFIFGCWTFVDLCTVHPEFCYPNLGHPTPGIPGDEESHTHGWFQLACRVDQDNNGTFDSLGGVHGALIQLGKTGGKIRRNDANALPLLGDVAWARLLFQSVTTGDPVSLHLEGFPGGLN